MPGSTAGGGGATAIGAWLGVTTGGAGWTTAWAGCALSMVMSATSPAPRAKPARPPTPTKTTAREAFTPAMSRVAHPGQRRVPVPSGLEQAGHAKMFASNSPIGRDDAVGVPRPRRPNRPTFWLPISSVMGLPRDLAAGRSRGGESGPVAADHTAGRRSGGRGVPRPAGRPDWTRRIDTEYHHGVDTTGSPIDAALGQAGYRATAARRAVVDLITRRDGHFTAADLVDDAQRRGLRHRASHDLPDARRPHRAAGGRATRPADR